MKKILFTALTGFPKEEIGGPNRIINLLYKNLPSEKFQCEFVSKHGRINLSSISDSIVKYKIDYSREYFFKKFDFYKKIFTSSFYLKRFFKNSIDIIKKNIEESDYDILNSHDIRTIFGLKNLKSAILSVHSIGSIVKDMCQLYGDRIELKSLYKDFLLREKEIIGKVYKVIFPSESAKLIYFADLELDEKKIRNKVIYNGIDLKKIDEIKPDEKFLRVFKFLNSNKLKILNISNHIKVKNVDKILFLLSEFKKINDKFVFINVGSGPLSSMLRSYTKKLSLENDTVFINYLPNVDVIKLMKSCDVYISLSERVVFDLVILEALACGMKVIASNDGGNREAIVDGFNGYLINSEDREKIIELLSRKDDVHIRTNAKKSTLKFSVENMVNEYIEVYEEIQN